MIMDIIMSILLVILLGFIVSVMLGGLKKDKMSFKESMDLTGLPVITLLNNNTKFNFLLDTGSTYSIINKNALSTFKGEEMNAEGSVFGMDGNKIKVNYLKAELKYKETVMTEEFQVVDMQTAFDNVKKETGVTISGILGSSFLQENKYVLDFKELIAYSKR